MSPDLSATTTTASVRVAPDEREAFCREHLVTLAKALGLFVRDAALGEELAQEALLRACARWPQVRALDSPRAWLYRVGINLARSRARRMRCGCPAGPGLPPGGAGRRHSTRACSMRLCSRCA